MLQTLKNAWKIPELRKKLLFTLFILLIYRLGSVIPVPFIDVTTLANYFDSVLSSTILGLYNAMSGSAFSRATVLALGIQPYINASIIIQLLTVAIPALERLAKEVINKAASECYFNAALFIRWLIIASDRSSCYSTHKRLLRQFL